MMRPYNYETDFGEAEALLTREGVTRNALNRVDGRTFILEKNRQIIGLFVIRFLVPFPYLVHFIVKKEAREFGARNALKLVRYMDKMLHDYGFKLFVISLAIKRCGVCLIVERYFKNRIERVRTFTSGEKFYLVRTV